MAHFYGSMQGQRGEVTRTGTKSSGLEASLTTREIEGIVQLSQNNDGIDTLEFFVSLIDGKKELVASFEYNEKLIRTS